MHIWRVDVFLCTSPPFSKNLKKKLPGGTCFAPSPPLPNTFALYRAQGQRQLLAQRVEYHYSTLYVKLQEYRDTNWQISGAIIAFPMRRAMITPVIGIKFYLR